MSTFSRNTATCRYHHDALDRLSDSAFPNSDNLQRFYCKTRLATEIQGPMRHSLFQHDDRLMAQHQHRDGSTTATLLATDRQRSVCNVLDVTETNPIVYTAYGHRSGENRLLSLLGFNGERPDPLTGHYHLGNGYRQFNPVLMRFNSPDNLSPFEKGGLNPYAYCVGDPVNRSDPTGHFPSLLVVGFVSGAVVAVSGFASMFVEDDSLAIGLEVLAGAALAVGFFAGGRYYLKHRRPTNSGAVHALPQPSDIEMRPRSYSPNQARQPASTPPSSLSSNPGSASSSRPETLRSATPNLESDSRFGPSNDFQRIPRVRSIQNSSLQDFNTNLRTI
jgi:RHS repeat-associated protein